MVKLILIFIAACTAYAAGDTLVPVDHRLTVLSSLHPNTSQNKTLAPVKKYKSTFGQYCAQSALHFYQNNLSVQFGHSCCFTPSCSRYSSESIQHYGLLRGILLTADRLVRCNGIKPDVYSIDSIGRNSDPVAERKLLP
jgi:putative membrane protein insertion efficiency factor